VLNQLDTSEISPTAQVIPLRNVMRPDEPRPSLPVEDVLQNAPARDGNYFRVPPVLD
jgi:aspartyl-tRNA(Asn)/glutamyl-tRNA(Gln) amidotransferase subunit C